MSSVRIWYAKNKLKTGEIMASFPKSFYRWRPHPWHGLEAGENSPEVVNAFIEMTPDSAWLEKEIKHMTHLWQSTQNG